MLERPELLPGEEFYLNAYLDLSTCGNPIPWTAIVQYADRYGMDRVMSHVFHGLMRALEGHHRERQQREGHHG